MESNEVLRKVREFVRDELIGNEAHLDSLAAAPLPLYAKFAALGISNWWLPESVGGLGLSLEDSVEVVTALAYGDAGVAFTLFIPILGTSIVSLYGHYDQRESFLAPMAAEGRTCAILGSELDAGSELSRISTTTVRTGDELVVNGDKAFATNADFADFLLVITASAGSVGDYQAVLIPRNTPGIRIVKRWDVIGLRSSATYQVSFTDCRVPAANRLRGNGLSLLEAGLNASRILIASTAIGLARRIVDLGMAYARSKTLKGAKFVTHPVLANRIGQAEMLIDTMESACRTAAREYDQIVAEPNPGESFLRRGGLKGAITAKMFCGQAGWQIAGMASEMFGGLGYTNDLAVGKLLRDMRHISILEGGDDALREVLFKSHVIPRYLQGGGP